MPTLDTPGLQLRPLGQADETLYCRLYTDPEVMRHIAAPLSAEAARAAFAAVSRLSWQVAPTMQVWIVRDRAIGADIGIVALIAHADLPGAREVGAMLLVEGRLRGVAAAAIGAVADHLFDPGDTLGADVHQLWTRHAPGNEAAMRLMLRMGFLRQVTCGADEAELRWRMSRERWNAGRLARNGKT